MGVHMTIKKTGKTTEEAIELGLRELDITSDQANITVIREASKGFFGIGKKDALVRISKKDIENLPDLKELIEQIDEEKIKEIESLFEDFEEDCTEEHNEKIKEEQRETAKNFLQEMMDTMGIEADININMSGKNLNIDIFGNNVGILIGKRGTTLESIQYITNLVVNKGKTTYANVILDVENYRSRRKENLESLAFNLAKRVKNTGSSIVLEPMTSYERRIIHYALEKEKEVYTKSKGLEPHRCVVIRPRESD